MIRIAALAFVIAGLCGAVVHRVPQDYPTIQAGLSAADPGDTVLVASGTYSENITWPNIEGIKLYSESGPESTVIDGGDNGRVIFFSSPTFTRATELKGFTILGGRLVSGNGAGIHNNGGSPVIADNIIRNNVHAGTRNHGGGIYTSGDPLIIRNIIRSNRLTGPNWNFGAGIYIAAGSPEICFNVIDSNRSTEGEWNFGAGIFVATDATPLIWQNTISDNAGELGNRGYGAGVYDEGRAVIFSNLITGNINSAASWNSGAGIYGSGYSRLFNNTIVGNICRNGTWNYGGGVYIGHEDTVIAQNNIIVSNSAGLGGGFYRADNEKSILDNHYNNVWENVGGNYVNSVPGPGDFSDDPLFATGILGGHYLSHTDAGQPAASPCVNAGHELPVLPIRLDTLLAGWTTRTDERHNPGNPDIGYHYPITGQVGIKEYLTERPPALPLRVEPNPTRDGQVILHHNLPYGRSARLAVYDISGRPVVSRSLVINESASSIIPLDLSNLSNGIYVVMLQSQGFSSSLKLVKGN